MMDLFKQTIRERLKRNEKKNSVVGLISNLKDIGIVKKDIRLSQTARVGGDKLYAEDNLEVEHQHRIIRLYNESIAYAPLESEDLAQTYANKSALLRRMRKYSECISEADKALKITKSISLKIKLLCREAECFTALGSPENRGCLEKARFFITRSEMSQESEKMKKMLKKLIKKTQEVIDENKLDTPKEIKRYSQTSKLVANVQEEELWQHSVKVDYSEKYGLCLIAARDFEPGEMILLERPYHFHLQYKGIYQYCYHCLNYLWTVVPCDHCNWREYCSVKCKNDSWNEYHDLECSVASVLKTKVDARGSLGFFVLSIFFKMMKEAGSLGQLIADIESLDQKGGPCIDDITSDGRFNYKSIYALPLLENLTDSDLQESCEDAIIPLVALGTLTNIFENTKGTHGMKIIKKLMDNEDAIFVGALLMKLIFVMTRRGSQVELIDPTDITFSLISMDHMPKEDKNDGSFTHCFDTLGRLVQSCCVPNVKAIITRKFSMVWHSLQPIKKGDRLTLIDVTKSVYGYIPTSIRQSEFKKLYNFSCDCRACAENWSVEYFKRGWYESNIVDKTIVAQLVEECNHFVFDKKSYSRKFYNPDMKTVSRARDLLVRAWKHCEMPSTTIVRAVRIYMDTLGLFYGPSRHDYWK